MASQVQPVVSDAWADKIFDSKGKIIIDELRKYAKATYGDPVTAAAFVATVKAEAGTGTVEKGYTKKQALSSFITYKKDKDGKIILDANKKPIPISTKMADRLARLNALPTNASGEEIFNIVYDDATRSGSFKLGNTEAGDGYKYRGRGLIQITGKDKYKKLGDRLGVDLVANPELLDTDKNLMLRATSLYLDDKNFGGYLKSNNKSAPDLTSDRLQKIIGHNNTKGEGKTLTPAEERWADAKAQHTAMYGSDMPTGSQNIQVMSSSRPQMRPVPPAVNPTQTDPTAILAAVTEANSAPPPRLPQPILEDELMNKVLPQHFADGTEEVIPPYLLDAARPRVASPMPQVPLMQDFSSSFTPPARPIPVQNIAAPRPTMLGGQLFYLNGDGTVSDQSGSPVQDPAITTAVRDKLNYSPEESAANAQAYNESMLQQQESNAAEAEKIRAEIAQINMERQALNEDFDNREPVVVSPRENGPFFVEGFVPPVANSNKGGPAYVPPSVQDSSRMMSNEPLGTGWKPAFAGDVPPWASASSTINPALVNTDIGDSSAADLYADLQTQMAKEEATQVDFNSAGIAEGLMDRAKIAADNKNFEKANKLKERADLIFSNANKYAAETMLQEAQFRSDAEEVNARTKEEELSLIEAENTWRDSQGLPPVPTENKEPEVPPVVENSGKDSGPPISNGAGLSTDGKGIVTTEENKVVDKPEEIPGLFEGLGTTLGELGEKIGPLLKTFFGLETTDITRALGFYAMSRLSGASHEGSMRWAGTTVLKQAENRDILNSKNSVTAAAAFAKVSGNYKPKVSARISTLLAAGKLLEAQELMARPDSMTEAGKYGIDLTEGEWKMRPGYTTAVQVFKGADGGSYIEGKRKVKGPDGKETQIDSYIKVPGNQIGTWRDRDQTDDRTGQLNAVKSFVGTMPNSLFSAAGKDRDGKPTGVPAGIFNGQGEAGVIKSIMAMSEEQRAAGLPDDPTEIMTLVSDAAELATKLGIKQIDARTLLDMQLIGGDILFDSNKITDKEGELVPSSEIKSFTNTFQQALADSSVSSQAVLNKASLAFDPDTITMDSIKSSTNYSNLTKKQKSTIDRAPSTFMAWALLAAYDPKNNKP
jgi:hypothetical protein